MCELAVSRQRTDDAVKNGDGRLPHLGEEEVERVLGLEEGRRLCSHVGVFRLSCLDERCVLCPAGKRRGP